MPAVDSSPIRRLRFSLSRYRVKVLIVFLLAAVAPAGLKSPRRADPNDDTATGLWDASVILDTSGNKHAGRRIGPSGWDPSAAEGG